MEQINPIQPNPSQLMAYQLTFPEIYYKLQPYIIMICDQINPMEMPTQEMIEYISDSVYEDICKKYPDMEAYVGSQETKVNSDPPIMPVARFGDPRMFGHGFRRRGLFRDIIDILLLSELFNRRRRYYY